MTSLPKMAALCCLVILAVLGYVELIHRWFPPEQVCNECPEPQPKIEDHVAAVMKFPSSPGISHGQIRAGWISHEIQDGDCAQLKDGIIKKIPCCQDCPTYETLKRAGVEVICTYAFGEVPSVNYWPQDMPMACNRIKEVRITNDKIRVIGGKR